jgi:hypothetical protein
MQNNIMFEDVNVTRDIPSQILQKSEERYRNMDRETAITIGNIIILNLKSHHKNNSNNEQRKPIRHIQHSISNLVRHLSAVSSDEFETNYKKNPLFKKHMMDIFTSGHQ